LNNVSNNKGAIGSAIGICVGSGAQSALKAVKLRKSGGGFEVVWKKSCDNDRKNRDAFFKEVFTSGQTDDLQGSATALGIESGRVSFYRINIPPVEASQAEAIVMMQAEALLPLGVEQMRLAWRFDGTIGGKQVVTLAAGRREQYDEYVLSARKYHISKMVLDYEGVVKAWGALFGGTEEKCVVVDIRPASTSVLLVERGRLCHAVTLDSGFDDLGDEQQGGVELFVHDLRNALELFGAGGSQKSKIFVLSAEADSFKELISYLADAGLNACAAVCRPGELEGGGLTAGEVCEYLGAIGTAMLALDADGRELNLFADLTVEPELEAATQQLSVLKRRGLIAAVMVVLFLFVFYTIDRASLGRLENSQLGGLAGQYDTRKLIASERPDILGLLTKINECRIDDMLINDFAFKKHQPVVISSQVKSYEKLYEFQKKLESQKGITAVKILNPSFNEKNKKVGFKMSFEYGVFTRKKK
jgi:hypothetical protein